MQVGRGRPGTGRGGVRNCAGARGGGGAGGGSGADRDRSCWVLLHGDVGLWGGGGEKDEKGKVGGPGGGWAVVKARKRRATQLVYI